MNGSDRDQVVARLKQCTLDALGCCLFGVTLPWTKMLIELATEEGGNPRARVIGTPLATSVSQAVLIGATAGHGFEMDDIHAAAHLHAGSLALPAALAVADTLLAVSGRELTHELALARADAGDAKLDGLLNAGDTWTVS